MNRWNDRVWIPVVLAAAGWLPAQETTPPAPKVGWRPLIGEAAPEISAASWFNVGDQVASVEALRGKVWLLEFFATW